VSKRTAYSRSVARWLVRLDPELRRRIVAAIDAYAASGRGDVVRLTGRRGQLRLRVGDYRIVLVSQPEHIEVIWAGHRRDAYKD
jgi:mRNA interferase RelE/StbE